MSMFRLRITTYKGMDIAEHYYGSVRIPPERDPKNEYSITLFHDDEELGEGTCRFWNQKDVVQAAKEWFLKSELVKPGDKLTVWKGYLADDLEYGDRAPSWIGY